MKWITRSHVHVDRVACPWLITRFIDSHAEFLFVPKSKVMEIAAKEGAIPFDTPGAELHHRGDQCSFDAIIKDYELTDKALLRMAKIVNAADTNRLEADPLAAGLEAIAVGYSLRYPEDAENIERQFEVYDALYAWCRLDVARNQTAAG
ncbi:MAG: chromate resistance protein [Acidobacteria bacterium]|nr:MAG: chromate resistance protein [Acidobacteriota bacterium]